jgi:ribosome-binding protein aMBF1 (putative translation factor)
MGSVIALPGCHAAISRAAKLAKSSAVTPLDRASSVPITDAHHSAGMALLCHHFETADGLAPMSAASASRVGQSSMTSRNEFMPDVLGQSVLNCKANPSCDATGRSVLQSGMGKSQPSSEFKRAFTAAIKAAREAKGLTQEQVAGLLGLKQDHYKQYEGRTLMPHELIPIFCDATGADITRLFKVARAAVMQRRKKSA